MERKQILHKALEQLNNSVRDKIDQLTTEKVFTLSKRLVDSSAAITINSNDTEQTYNVYVQTWAPQKELTTLIAQLKAMPSKTILFADFINPVMAEKLRKRGIHFVDCAGNIFFSNQQFKIFVKGRKLSQLSGRRVRGRAFNSAGLKLIFALFNQPNYLNASYRDISNKVNIALGSVGPVIDDLYASGYILDDGEKKLVNKKRLYERWVDGYLEKLRPKQIMACYSSGAGKDWWKTANPADFHGVWGGEVVVAKSTPFMAPEKVSLYFFSEEKQKNFAKHYGLQKNNDGEICIYKSFWSPSYAGDENIDCLSPMIVYADIVDAINPASWDVAKTFYGEAIAHLLQD